MMHLKARPSTLRAWLGPDHCATRSIDARSFPPTSCGSLLEPVSGLYLLPSFSRDSRFVSAAD